MPVSYADKKKEFNPYRKKPDYYYCFMGELIFKEWKIRNGLTSLYAKILIITTYYTFFKLKNYKYWLMDLKQFKQAIADLVKMGYIVQTSVPGDANRKPCRAWMLTKKGKDLEADFEKYYDMRFKEIQQGRFGIFIDFKDGAPFRRIKNKRKTTEYREFKANGQPKKVGILDMWKDLDYDES